MTTALGFSLIASGSSVGSLTHNLATNSAVITAAIPNYNTTVWIGSKVSNSCTLYLGTQASSGSRIDWRAEV